MGLLPLAIACALVLQESGPSDPTVTVAPSAQPWTIVTRGGGSADLASDLDDDEGDVDIHRARLGFTLVSPPGLVSNNSVLSFDLDQETSWYRFGDALGLASGVPDEFRDVRQTSFRTTLMVRQDERWSWLAGAMLMVAGETDADAGESTTFGGYAAAKYAVAPDLKFGLGFVVRSRLEEDPLTVPMIGVEWRIADWLSFSSGERAGARLAAQASDTVDVALFGNWELREYRLSDSAALSEGIVRDLRVPVGLELEWRPAPTATVTLSGGVTMRQEFRFDDRDGEEQEDTSARSSAFLSLLISLSF